VTDETRRHVLEHPHAYSAEDRADAWAMTARQCRENGVEWAAEIADAESESARQLTLVETR
jgi:hypothetical protein